MSTAHVIQVGYNSAHHKKDVWKELKEYVGYLCSSNFKIADEAKKYTSKISHDQLDEFGKSYKECKDLTIRIHDNEDVDECYIRQMSSGGGVDREIKEQLRRAFCRLVLERMHSLNMEINISVG